MMFIIIIIIIIIINYFLFTPQQCIGCVFVMLKTYV